MDTKDLRDAGMLVIKDKINAKPGDKPYLRGSVKDEDGKVMKVVGFYAEKETKDGLLKYFYLKKDMQEEFKKTAAIKSFVATENTNPAF